MPEAKYGVDSRVKSIEPGPATKDKPSQCEASGKQLKLSNYGEAVRREINNQTWIKITAATLLYPTIRTLNDANGEGRKRTFLVVVQGKRVEKLAGRMIKIVLLGRGKENCIKHMMEHLKGWRCCEDLSREISMKIEEPWKRLAYDLAGLEEKSRGLDHGE